MKKILFCAFTVLVAGHANCNTYSLSDQLSTPTPIQGSFQDANVTAERDAAKIGNTPLVIQITGAPASGKSQAISRLSKYFHKDVQLIAKNADSFDLDIIREKFNKLSGDTKFYIIIQALDLYRRIGVFHEERPNFSFKWQVEAAKSLLAMFQKGGKIKEAFEKKFKIDLSYDIDKGLMINGRQSTPEDTGRLYNLRILFEDFDNITLGNIVNRYDVLIAVMENTLLQRGIKLDNVGSSSKDIIERLKYLRSNNYASMSVVIHPQTPLLNLFLNSLRAVNGGHYPPSSMILNKYNAVSSVLDEYTDSSEQQLWIHSDADLPQITEFTRNITTEDNTCGDNSTKAMDLILVDMSRGLKEAFSILEKTSDTQKKKQIASLWIASIADIYNQLDKFKETSKECAQKLVNDAKGSPLILELMQSINYLEVVNVVTKLSNDSTYIRNVFKDEGKLKELVSKFYDFCEIANSNVK